MEICRGEDQSGSKKLFQMGDIKADNQLIIVNSR